MASGRCITEENDGEVGGGRLLEDCVSLPGPEYQIF